MTIRKLHIYNVLYSQTSYGKNNYAYGVILRFFEAFYGVFIECMSNNYWSIYRKNFRLSSWITDASGSAKQHLQYLSYGEYYIYQRNNEWDAPYTFSGKEKDSETGYSYFGARYYDSDISVWLSVDPLSDKYPSMSPFIYTTGNPVMLVDPDGRAANPIYDKSGSFLGTDDKGLKGEAIIMNNNDFVQGMAHNKAMKKGSTLDKPELPLVLSDKGKSDILKKISNHQKTLSSRPDWDGQVTREEGIAWAKSHPNLRSIDENGKVDYSKAKPNDYLYLDASKMNFGSLNVKDFARIGDVERINLLNYVNLLDSKSINTTYALGKTRMTLLNNSGAVKVINGVWNAYDWDYGGGKFRNALIWSERTINNLNDSHGFPLSVYGKGNLNK